MVRDQQELAKKPGVQVSALPLKKRGRPVLLGDRLDVMVQKYVAKLREDGGIINTDIVTSGTHGILKSVDRTRLMEFGGHVSLTKSWAKSFFCQMNFRKRNGITTCKSDLPVEQFRKVKAAFLQEIIDTVMMEDIPSELIFNLDQTGLNLVPSSLWTMARKGSKHVEIKGLNDTCK